MTLVTSIVPWQCTLNERLKKVHHVGVYLMKVHGLHWRAIWPLMKSPYNIPFWGPGAMYNPLERLNLPKIEKKICKKITKTWYFSVLEAIRGHERSQMPTIKCTMTMYIEWEAQKGTSCWGLFNESSWPPLEGHLFSNEPPIQYTFLRSWSNV